VKRRQQGRSGGVGEKGGKRKVEEKRGNIGGGLIRKRGWGQKTVDETGKEKGSPRAHYSERA